MIAPSICRRKLSGACANQKVTRDRKLFSRAISSIFRSRSEFDTLNYRGNLADELVVYRRILKVLRRMLRMSVSYGALVLVGQAAENAIPHEAAPLILPACSAITSCGFAPLARMGSGRICTAQHSPAST